MTNETNSGQIKRYTRNKGFESISRELLQNTTLSLESIGLMCHLLSLPEDYKIFKTQLYNKFEKNKKTSIARMWKELVDQNYIIEFKTREGKKYTYDYIISQEPFSYDEILLIAQDYPNSDFWTSDFRNPKMNSSKPVAIKNNYKKEEEDIIIPDQEINTPVMDFVEKNEDARAAFKYFRECNVPIDVIVRIMSYLMNDLRLLDLNLIGTQMSWCATKNDIKDFAKYFVNGLEKLVESNSVRPKAIEKELPKVTLHNWLEQ